MMQTGTEENEIINSKGKLFCRAAILAIGLLLLSRNIDGWLTGWHEGNNAIYSIFARNHIQYGLGYTRGFMTWGDTATPPAQPRRYLNHPPLLALWAAVPMSLFGDHDWVSRLVPIATTLASAFLLIVIVGRLTSTSVGLLSGFFYVILPATAYFGRMLDQTSPCQFFSLLMLHGYLQWVGLYGERYSRKTGSAYYAVGAVFGIWTGWACIIMAGLIWLWQSIRTLRYKAQAGLLLAITLITAGSLAAVVVHILWGNGWDVSLFKPLFLSRTVSPEQPVPWAKWLYANWMYAGRNFSIFGLSAAVVYPGVVAVILRRCSETSPLRRIVHNKGSLIPILLIGLQGLLWVVVFKHQSWVHDYWQYFAGPFVAVSMASVLLSLFTVLWRLVPRLACWVVLLLMILPMPFFAGTLDLLHRQRSMHNEELVLALENLARLVPQRVPVMVSEQYRGNCESFGGYTNCYPDIQTAYYANRPLIFSIDISEIDANRHCCAAYLLHITGDKKTHSLLQKLRESYPLVWSEGGYLIFLLDKKSGD
jgi:hypothetical protein